VFVNPTITGRSAEHAVMEEGCLSIPDTPWRVARPAWIDAAWQGLDGAAMAGRFTGFVAVGFQHELDHLDGRLILDHPPAP
ncbi:MAG: peptide deformylase, partial [Shimia sp.]